MQIIISDTNEMTALDRSVLAVLSGTQTPATTVGNSNGAPHPKASEGTHTPPKAPVKKAAAAPPKKEEPVAEQPEEVEEEREADDTETAPEETYDIAEAVKVATDLVSNGKGREVKALLSNMGAAAVSKLQGAAIGEFLAAASKIK